MTEKTSISKREARGKDKMARIPVKIVPSDQKLAKPAWLKIKLQNDSKVQDLKNLLRKHNLHTVCEEATCPNLNECFGHGTATFMIMGDKCTRRCTFCDVAHGKPAPLDKEEPANLAAALSHMNLKYIVITSVDRDDLRDGGAGHFSECIQAVRDKCPTTKIEVLVPDFRGRMEAALGKLIENPPDVFNHNLETVSRLYKAIRPGSDYAWSLLLLKEFKQACPEIPTKSGLMLGLGETNAEIIQTLEDMRAHDIDMLTLGQYLQPSKYHAPVKRYVSPAEFEELKEVAVKLQFSHVASAPFVRSSYHADLQAQGKL